jgi:hypothetical protein
MKRMKQFMAATLGMFILGVVFTSTAMASHDASFVITNQQPTGFVAPATVDVQDTSTGGPFEEIAWDCSWSPNDPANFQAEKFGSTATCYYPEGGTYIIGERVTAHGVPDYDGMFVTVASNLDAPADLVLNGPTSVGLANTFDFLSPKANVRADCTMYQGGICAANVLGGSGVPDGNGFYHHQIRIPVSKMDGTSAPDLALTVYAWNTSPSFSDVKTFDIDVTSNTVDPFGELSTNLLSTQQKAAKCVVSSDLGFYIIVAYRAKITLKADKDGKWQTVAQEHTKGGTPGSYVFEQVYELDKTLAKGTRVKVTQRVKGFYKKSKTGKVRC